MFIKEYHCKVGDIVKSKFEPDLYIVLSSDIIDNCQFQLIVNNDCGQKCGMFYCENDEIISSVED